MAGVGCLEWKFIIFFKYFHIFFYVINKDFQLSSRCVDLGECKNADNITDNAV